MFECFDMHLIDLQFLFIACLAYLIDQVSGFVVEVKCSSWLVKLRSLAAAPPTSAALESLGVVLGEAICRLCPSCELL